MQSVWLALPPALELKRQMGCGETSNFVGSPLLLFFVIAASLYIHFTLNSWHCWNQRDTIWMSPSVMTGKSWKNGSRKLWRSTKWLGMLQIFSHQDQQSSSCLTPFLEVEEASQTYLLSFGSVLKRWEMKPASLSAFIWEVILKSGGWPIVGLYMHRDTQAVLLGVRPEFKMDDLSGAEYIFSMMPYIMKS